jgi:putative DNA methylase
VRSVVRASRALKSPTEPTPIGPVKAVVDAPPGKANIRCGDARDLHHVPDRSIDLVLTDPPYFDYISYSELGHFFAPWLARFGLISSAKSKTLPRAQLASKARSLEAESRFTKKLAEAFCEIRRVCKPASRVVFTYQNLDGRGWNAIAKALAATGIHPVQTFPLYGDSSTSLHKHENSISWDCVMVCRLGPQVEKNFAVSAESRDHGMEAAQRWERKLSASGFALTEGDKKNIANAAAIIAEFHTRSKADPEPSIRKARAY